MKALGFPIIILFLLFFSCESKNDVSTNKNDSSLTPVSVFEDAFTNKRSNIQVKQSGDIVAILADDNNGARHQRLIVKLLNDQTLLISHNIDLAPRVVNPVKGRQLTFYGEYEWNSKGGVIHWTHKDPNASHINGWLEYDGKIYQ
jgi:hypothetical protein